jgi:hypothetical protein
MPLMWRTQTLNMDWCLSCHRDPSAFVRPREEVFSVDWNPDSLSAERRAELAREYHLKSMMNCSVCHR